LDADGRGFSYIFSIGREFLTPLRQAPVALCTLGRPEERMWPVRFWGPDRNSRVYALANINNAVLKQLIAKMAAAGLSAKTIVNYSGLVKLDCCLC
jgi:hypothetical protein